MIQAAWNDTLAHLPGTHILQTVEWGELKSHLGWKPIYKNWTSVDGKVTAAAMILQRQIPIRGFGARINILYVPRGPILDWSDEKLRNNVLGDLVNLARKIGAIFIKIDPEVIIGTGIPGSNDQQNDLLGETVIRDFQRCGWRFSSSQIQFRNSFWIGLDANEDSLLAQMKQKTRYNIRLAQRKGVQTRLGNVVDLCLMYQMYAETSLRDGFSIRDQDYYVRTWKTFLEKGLADLLIAEVDNEPVAGLVLFRFGGKAIYMYGMSRDIHREKMPTYLLQWAAIQRAKETHCTIYDLWGAPDHFTETDPMWGVFKFKEGLGGKVIRTCGAWDFPVNRLFYFLYNQLVPAFLNILRQRGRLQTSRSVEYPKGDYDQSPPL